MTVAIGLACSDGVLVASDSKSSSGGIARLDNKVYAMGSLPLVWTASGSVYVIEELASALHDHEVDALDSEPIRRNYLEPRPDRVRQNLGTVVRSTMLACYNAALPLGGSFLSGDGRHKFATDVLLLGYANGTAYFLEIGDDGQMNWHTSHNFYAIGSGGDFASVAHALMQHYLSDGPLTLRFGMQLAYRTIETTCEVSASGVGLPVQIAVVDDRGPRLLGAEEIDELKTLVDGWKQLERETLLGETRLPASGETGDLPDLGKGPHG